MGEGQESIDGVQLAHRQQGIGPKRDEEGVIGFESCQAQQISQCHRHAAITVEGKAVQYIRALESMNACSLRATEQGVVSLGLKEVTVLKRGPVGGTGTCKYVAHKFDWSPPGKYQSANCPK